MRACSALFVVAICSIGCGGSNDGPPPGWPPGAFDIAAGAEEVRWSDTPRPWIVGRRGTGTDRDREAYAENTVPAMIEAIAAEGAVGVEIDVRLTLDGEPVVIHDARLDRTTECSGCVSERSLADVRACRATGGRSGGHPPSLLEALHALEALPVTPLVIVDGLLDSLDGCPEPGGSRDEHARRLVEAVLGAVDSARAVSFVWLHSPADAVRIARYADSRVGTLVDGTSVPPSIDAAVAQGADGIGVPLGSLDRQGVTRARRAGLVVDTYVVDAPIDLAVAVSCGADIVETNEVRRLIASFD